MIVRECRLISSVTKMSLKDLIAQRQTQSLLRVVHSTGALRGMKDAQVIHIVNDGKFFLFFSFSFLIRSIENTSECPATV